MSQINSKLAPILLFVYKRPAHTRQTLEALAANELASESTLYIYSDGPAHDANEEDRLKIDEVREVIAGTQWCGEVKIIEAVENKGLANSIIDGVTERINEHGKVIVLEDDIVISTGFLEYMNEALNRYADEKSVMQISGHQYPLDIPAEGNSFFLSLTTSWGWATWRRAWQQFDPMSKGYEQLKTDRNLKERFDLQDSVPYSNMLIDQMESDRVNSWAIRWWWTVFKNNGVSLFPDKSLVRNIGFGKDASHTKGRNPFETSYFQSDYLIKSYPREVLVRIDYFVNLQSLLRTKHNKKQGIIPFLVNWCKDKIHSLSEVN